MIDKKQPVMNATNESPISSSVSRPRDNASSSLILAENGVLSIPQEEPTGGCCRSCCWCLCCLPYYLFCCCCCWKQKEFSAAKPDFIKRFTKWLPSSGVRASHLAASADRDPIPVLIQLYSCEPNAVDELASCRLNPDLKATVRKDLEFYIPQILSFYLQGYYPNMQQLVDLIVQACKTDFYFSHRIYFFLKSVTFEALTDPAREEEQKTAVDTVLKNIYKMICDQVEEVSTQRGARLTH